MTPAEISAIRRAAARARWDAKREPTVRLTVTIPSTLAAALRAAQAKTGHTPSTIVAEALADLLHDKTQTAPAPTATPFDITADACAVDPATALPTLIRAHYHADGADGAHTRVSDEDGIPDLPDFLRARRAEILAQLIPALTLAERTQITLTRDGLPVVIMARKGIIP